MKVAVGKPHLIGLPPEEVVRVFPFCLAWDRDMRIETVGGSMTKICPGVKPGEGVHEHFHMERPVGEMSWRFLRDNTDKLFLFGNAATGISFRGEIVNLEETSLFLCSPWLSSPDQLEQFGLNLNDFGLHDQTVDLLEIVQSQKMANRDLHGLAAKLTAQRTKLREQEAESRKLALVASRTDDGVIIADANGRIEWVNAGFEALTGWSLEEVLGEKPGRVLQGVETDPSVVAQMRCALAEGRGFNIETVNYNKDGVKYWVAVEVQPVFSEDGVLSNFIGVQRDITGPVMEKKRRALQLAVSVLLSEGDGLESTIEKVLAKICEECGWTAGIFWLLGNAGGESPLLSISVPGDHDLGKFVAETRTRERELGDAWNAIMTESGSLPNSKPMRADLTIPGSAVARELELRQILGITVPGDREVFGVLEFFTLDARKEARNELREMLEAVGAQVGQFLVRKMAERALVRSTAEAEAANHAKSEFLATMSHEIRTPMNGVLGFAQILGESELSAQQRDYVTSIDKSANALLVVINDVLDFSKVESGIIELESRDFDLIECLEDAMDTVSGAVEEKDLELVTRYHGDLPPVIQGDEFRLRQVLVNLLSNAVKFTEQGWVSVDLDVARQDEEGIQIMIRVADSGIGIEADMLPKLFKSFRQADSSTTRRFGGSGLGLAISKKIIELMAGSVAVESKPGEGSVFTVSLTLPPAAKSGLPFPLAPQSELRDRRVLLIHGREQSRESLADVLVRWGIDLRVASSPAEGIREMAGWQADTILLDGGFAFDAIADLLRHDLVTRARLFLMVRRSDEELVRRAFTPELAGLLTKPIRLAHLRQAVSRETGKTTELVTIDERISGGGESSPTEQILRILLVEDNRVNQKFALAALEHMGLTADLAQNGLEALDAVQAKEYDVILMDVHMPEMDGLTATRKIRELEAEQGTARSRIIGVTANAISGHREICRTAGMDECLAKPVQLNALRTMLTEMGASALPVDATTSEAPQEGDTLRWVLQSISQELSPADACEVGRDFCEELPVLLAGIENALEGGDASETHHLSHTLKGTASIFRLKRLVALAGRIEESAAAGHLGEVRELRDELRHAVERAGSDMVDALEKMKENRSTHAQ